MISRSDVEKQLKHTFSAIEFSGLGDKYSGKVRDCFTRGGERILVTTDRLSAFDKILTTIPFKGRLLNAMASYWFNATKNLVPNHLISEPHPNVFITREVEIIPIEVVVRGYLAGSAWRDYEAGNTISGVQLKSGMRKHQKLDKPVITPSTKSAQGTHDIPISSEEVVRIGIVDNSIWEQVSAHALALFDFGSKAALERGLILVDTKYEFGLLRKPGQSPQVVLADEIHTQDSSRYWVASTYMDRFGAGEDPEMLDKEFVRRWLIERNYMGDGQPPFIDDNFRIETALRYADVYQRITGKDFSAAVGPVEPEVTKVLQALIS